MTAPNNKPLTVEDSHRFADYYKANKGWSNLHIVLDDKNVKDKHVAACMEFAAGEGDNEGYYLAELLLGMSKSQRMKLAKTSF